MCGSIRKCDVVLRRLELLDAEPMLKWMLEPEIYRNMQYDPQEQNIEKCKDFMRQGWIDKENLHLAIASESGEYLGTVSLKNIDRKNSNAELAIAISPASMGKGISTVALLKIMEIAFVNLDLNKVYLYVTSDNE